MSLPGVLASHGRVPAYAGGRARTSRLPAGRTLGVLVALALGAMAVVVVLAVAVPQVSVLARVVGLAPAPPAPAPVPMVTATAVVTASASCVSPEPHDSVALEVAGARRQAVLDGCGRPPGTPVPVVVPADGHLTGPVTVAGSGMRTPTASTDVAGQGVSPVVARLELALAVAAALGAGALLVVVTRDHTRRAGTGPRRRPGRPGTGRVPAQRSRPAAARTRRSTGPHAVRPTRVRATRSTSARGPATTRGRR
ncbi:MAG TPA: hypothetical protein VGH76_21795 [Actinomycetospora sp.]|uniref:hypothetical protein n=1 Tax=Actinomycetospora sp. TaxID=1872135 RepID=UPI002F3F3FED